MRFSSLRYLIKQGWHNMAANRLMTFASIGVLTACLIITGIASLVSLDVQRVVEYLGNQNEIVVYVAEGVDETQTEALRTAITATPNVAEVQYVSKTDAYEEMVERMENYQSLLTGFESVFPASYRVTVQNLETIGDTAGQLRQLENVDDIATPSELAGVMVTLRNGVTYGGWAMVAVLGIVSIIIISNTVRLTVFARRREISIMKYVGATNAFIRLPFFVEGMTVGAIAGILSTGVVCGAYYLVMRYLTSSQNLWISSLISSLLKLEDIWSFLLVGFVAFGVVIGSIGTTSSIRKHLKV